MKREIIICLLCMILLSSCGKQRTAESQEKVVTTEKVTAMNAEEAKKVEEIKAKAEENHNNANNKESLEVTPVLNNKIYFKNKGIK